MMSPCSSSSLSASARGTIPPRAQTSRTTGGFFVAGTTPSSSTWAEGLGPRPAPHPPVSHTAGRHHGMRDMSTTTTPLTAAGPLTIDAYDTTLRDGAQQEGMNLSVADKLAIAALLDELGVGYIEGGWPGAIPKDTEFFARAAKELDLRHARLAAFGSTCKAGVRPHDDPQVRA